MSRPTSKIDMISAAETTYEKLNELISKLTKEEQFATFVFPDNLKAKAAHWGRDQNLRDVLIHLYEWHQLLLNWIQANRNNENKPFLPKPYNWKTYGDMNVVFCQKHQETTLEEAKELLTKSHKDILRIAETFTNEELFSKGVFPWVGGSTLGSYFVSETSSHYNWAMKKIRAHKKALNKFR